MKTIEFAGFKFQYEKLEEGNFKKGVCAFKMVDENGNTHYLVFVPNSPSERNKEINTPNDGILCADCPNEQAALMVASSIGIAIEMVGEVVGFPKNKKDEIERDINKLAEQLGFDVDALQREVDKLKAEGKSAKEAVEILKPRMEEFKKKSGSPSTDKGGEW